MAISTFYIPLYLFKIYTTHKVHKIFTLLWGSVEHNETISMLFQVHLLLKKKMTCHIPCDFYNEIQKLKCLF